MSINRNMNLMMLQVNNKSKSSSGQKIDNWSNVKEIEVAIYPASYTILTSANVKYADSTNTGLSTYKDIEAEKNRIVNGSDVYEVAFSNQIGKYTQLFLKKVIYNG